MKGDLLRIVSVADNSGVHTWVVVCGDQTLFHSHDKAEAEKVAQAVENYRAYLRRVLGE